LQEKNFERRKYAAADLEKGNVECKDTNLISPLELLSVNGMEVVWRCLR
jgi:hypothetical protein